MSDVLDVLLHFTILFCALVAYAAVGAHGRFSRYAFLYLLATLFFDGIAAAIMMTDFLSEYVWNNLFLYHILTPVQYTLVVLMYRTVIRAPRVERVMLLSVPLFWLAALAFVLFVQHINEYATYSLLLKYCLTIAIVLYFLHQVLSAPAEYDLTREPPFWIGVGFIFHAAGNIFVQGVANPFLINSDPFFKVLNTISSMLNYVLFLSFTVAFLRTRKDSNHERSVRSH